jgi:hypothetical protein
MDFIEYVSAVIWRELELKETFKMPQMAEEKPVVVSSIPNGGLNLAVQADQIADNESPEMLNMWQRYGVLKLRPGVHKAIMQSYGAILDIYPRGGRSLMLRRVTKAGVLVEEKYGFYIATQKAVLYYDGTEVKRVANSMINNGGWVNSYTDYNFTQCMFLPSASTVCSGQDSDSLTWTATGDVVYLVGGGEFFTISPQIVVYDYPSNVANVIADSLILAIQPHVPLLYSDCIPSGSGTANEDYNMLTPLCIQQFTTDATDKVYQLCDSNIDNTTLTAVYCTGTSTYTFNFAADFTISSQNNITAILDRNMGTIAFSAVLIDAKSAGIKNNLTVTFSKTIFTEIPVCCCDFGTWYGTSLGNSCLFLSGYDKQPNRVYYSAANDPTYFAQNSYINLGDPADPITAFGNQFDILAVFKDRSIFSISNESSSDNSFIVKEVNTSIGCDMPGSVQLADNFLLWGNTTGGVYALMSTTVKDERTVRQISQNINPSLLALATEDLQGASAVTDGRFYFLLIGSNAFVLDYSLMYLTSRGKAPNITWFAWNFPYKFMHIFLLGTQFATTLPDDGSIYIFDESCAADDGNFFDAYWYSKSFDLGLPQKLKKFYRLFLTIASSDMLKLQFCYRDDAGETDKTVLIEGTTSGIGKSITFSPPSIWSQRVSIGVKRLTGDLSAYSIENFTGIAVCGALIS